jgi:hypothetical protein
VDSNRIVLSATCFNDFGSGEEGGLADAPVDSVVTGAEAT